MKKYFERIVAIVLIASVCTTSVFAQYRHHHHHHYGAVDHAIHTANGVAGTALVLAGIASLDNYTGLRFGLNSASLRLGGSLTEDVDTDYLSGVNLGIVFGWNLGHSPLTLEPGIYYSFKGGKMSYYDTEAAKYKMHMLEFPLLLKYNIVPTAGVTFQPFVGPFVAFGLGGTTTYKAMNNEGYMEIGDYDTFNEDTFKSVDAGFKLGCGLEVNHLYVELSYDLGLVNLPACNYRDFGYDDWNDKIKTNCFCATIGVNF